MRRSQARSAGADAAGAPAAFFRRRGDGAAARAARFRGFGGRFFGRHFFRGHFFGRDFFGERFAFFFGAARSGDHRGAGRFRAIFEAVGGGRFLEGGERRVDFG